MANNPSAVAWAETRALSTGPLPDYAVSFGTGKFSQDPSVASPSLALLPRWLRRIGHCFLQGLDAERLYCRFVNQLPPRAQSRHHRINPSLSGPAVPLDDAAAMSRLYRLTRKQMSCDPMMVSRLDGLRLAMVASLFYPILTSAPTFDQSLGMYHVEMTIVSRWEDDVSVSTRLHAYLEGARFCVHGWQYRPVTPLHVRLTLPRLDDDLQVELQLEDGRRHAISGLPFPASRVWLMQPRRHGSAHQGSRTGSKRPSGDADAPLGDRKCARVGRSRLQPRATASSLPRRSQWRLSRP